MNFNRQTFWENYRREFGSASQSQVDAIQDLLTRFEDTRAFWQTIPEISYALATIKHETANSFLPITEYGNRPYFNKYDGRSDLGNTNSGDGYKFRGRGFVQITGRKNYAKFSPLVGVDLVSNPDFALNPITAFKIMSIGMRDGLFTGKKFSDYIAPKKCDYVNARRIINGTDKAALIAGYARQFQTILENSVSAAPIAAELESAAHFGDSQQTAVTPGKGSAINSGEGQQSSGTDSDLTTPQNNGDSPDN